LLLDVVALVYWERSAAPVQLACRIVARRVAIEVPLVVVVPVAVVLVAVRLVVVAVPEWALAVGESVVVGLAVEPIAGADILVVVVPAAWASVVERSPDT
jgi:hypothetical protein